MSGRCRVCGAPTRECVCDLPPDWRRADWFACWTAAGVGVLVALGGPWALALLTARVCEPTGGCF